MNVFFVGPYRQSDNWGKVSRSFLRLLHSQENVDVVSRPIFYNINSTVKDIGVLESGEHKKLSERDILIQFGLPITFVYDGTFKKNIAVTMVESKVENIGWTTSLNQMDQIIVFSETEKRLLEESGITTEITALEVAPFAFDNSMSEEIKIESNNRTIFYTDARPSDSSGLEQTITSYLNTFTSGDNVGLIVFSNQNEQEAVQKVIEDTKQKLSIFSDDRNYPSISIVPNKNQDILNYAHNNLSFYISIANNSVIGNEVMQAFMFNRPVILLDTYGKVLDGDSEYPLVVKSNEVVCKTTSRSYPSMNYGKDTWNQACEVSLSKIMLDVYNKDNIVQLSKELIGKFNMNFDNKTSTGVGKAICL